MEILYTESKNYIMKYLTRKYYIHIFKDIKHDPDIIAANYLALHGKLITIKLQDLQTMSRIEAVERYKGFVFYSVVGANSCAYQNVISRVKQLRTCKEQQ